MKLSIIIVNFNGKRFFDDCFQSIAKYVEFEHEVIVVDNASNDGSAEYVRNKYPSVKLIESERNLGFSRGNNLGARLAQGRFFLLLNNDTLLLNNLAPAIDLIERDASIGVLGICMLGLNRSYRYSAGYFPKPWRLLKFSLLYIKGGGFRDGKFVEKERGHSVDWVEGSFLLTPADLWRKLGGLDEAYFMYGEDIDYARRARDVGKRAIYLPQVSYVHFGGFNQARLELLIGGFRKYHQKHSGWATRFLANLTLDLGLIVRCVVFLCYSVINPLKRSLAWQCIRALRRN